MNQFNPLILRDRTGQNWLVRILDDNNGNKQLYSTKTDKNGVDFVKIKSYNGYFKIKITTQGKLVSYPLDSIG